MKVYVAGHNGMVGSSICRRLRENPDVQLVCKSREELDLLDQTSVFDFLQAESPDVVIMAAAKVGGIQANNSYPAEFIFENLQVQNHLIHGSHLADVQRLLFLGSSCIYPKFAEQPMSEDALLSGKFEPTNEPYAIAKIAGIKMCESYNRQYGRDYRSVMPTNLYGPGDNFHAENSHVIPGLMRRFHEAKTNGENEVAVWGSGNARREFLYVDDMAEAGLFVLNLPVQDYQAGIDPRQSQINIGTGQDVTIRELAGKIKEAVAFDGNIHFDQTKPDGAPRKLLNVDLINHMGWRHKVSLEEGLKKTYAWFLENRDNVRL